MTVVPGPIPLPITHYFCEADGKSCQHLRREDIHHYCCHGGHRHTVTSFMDAKNRLPAPRWCPLRGKESDE